MKLLTVKGSLFKIDRNLDADLHGDFDQSDRPPVRFRVGAN